MAEHVGIKANEQVVLPVVNDTTPSAPDNVENPKDTDAKKSEDEAKPPNDVEKEPSKMKSGLTFASRIDESTSKDEKKDERDHIPKKAENGIWPKDGDVKAKAIASSDGALTIVPEPKASKVPTPPVVPAAPDLKTSESRPAGAKPIEMKPTGATVQTATVKKIKPMAETKAASGQSKPAKKQKVPKRAATETGEPRRSKRNKSNVDSAPDAF